MPDFGLRGCGRWCHGADCDGLEGARRGQGLDARRRGGGPRSAKDDGEQWRDGVAAATVGGRTTGTTTRTRGYKAQHVSCARDGNKILERRQVVAYRADEEKQASYMPSLLPVCAPRLTGAHSSP